MAIKYLQLNKNEYYMSGMDKRVEFLFLFLFFNPYVNNFEHTEV